MTTTTSPSTPTTGVIGASSAPTVATTVRGALVGGAAALVGAGAVFAIGNIGAPVRVITGWAPGGADLTVAELASTTVVSVLVAAIGLVILDRVAANGLRIWAIAVAVVTVLSFLPLWRLDIDAGSKVALSVMHLVVGAAVVAGQQLVRRRT